MIHSVLLETKLKKITDYLPNFLVIENLNTQLKLNLKPLLHILKKKNL